MNLLPVIVSCQKNKQYWDSIIQLNGNAIIFYGDPTLIDNYNYDENKRILALKCNDFYEGLPEKMIALICAILELKCFEHIEYIFKIDDHDILNKIVNLGAVKHYLDLHPQIHYMGNRIVHYNDSVQPSRKWHFGKCSPGSYWEKRMYKGIYTTWADGGGGYILSRKAMEKIMTIYNFTNLDIIGKEHIFEDLMIALILNHFHIKPKQY